MLSEGFDLLKSLENCKISFPIPYKFITKTPKVEGLIVYINKKGRPNHIEYKTQEKFSQLWEYKKDNQNRFPIIKIKNPLCYQNNITNKLSGEKLKVLLENSKASVTVEEINKFKRIKKEYLKGNIQKVLTKSEESIDSFNELILRTFKINLKYFVNLLKDIMIKYLESNNLDEKDFISFIFGKWDNKKKKYNSKEIHLYLDIDNFEDFEYGKITSSERISSNLSRILLNIESLEHSRSGICSLSGGLPVSLEEGTFPKIRIPGGETFLLSMNTKDLPSLNRYDLKENIFPVGKKLANEIRAAIQYITEDNKESKTWKFIPTNKIGSSSGRKIIQNDLLICYLTNKPDFEGDLALISSWDGTPEYRETFFEEACSNLLREINVSQINYSSILNVFAIRKVDKGNSQVSLNESYTVAKLIEATEQWQAGSKNAIDLEFNIPFISDKALQKKSRKFVMNIIPYPLEMLSILQRKWKYSINYSKRVTNDDNFYNTASLTNISDIYKIFYNDPTIVKEPILEKILGELVVNNTNLLLNISHSLTRRKKQENSNIDETINIPDFHRVHTLLVISSIGILLYKLNIQKENYMKSAPYLAGRYFYWADERHKRYCDAERNREYPPQLIGNSCMRIASQSITKALAFLEDRILHYQAWANTDKENRAGFVLNEIGKVSEELSNLEIPNTIKEIEKAQLLLGYMTRIYKEKQ